MLSVSLQPKDSDGVEYALDVFGDFTLNEAVRAMYKYVNVSSVDIEESEAEPAEEHHDHDTLNKVLDALIAENFTPDSAQDVIRILLNAGILFRERV